MTDIFEMEGSEEELWADSGTAFLRGKNIMDGATTLSQAIELVTGYADYLYFLRDEGYELDGVIDNDLGLARITR